jgi:hypothetical protein
LSRDKTMNKLKIRQLEIFHRLIVEK